jgi:alcohol dehydrogenase (cytochrome c)
MLRWHFQFTPHDEHDRDSNQIPVLADLTIDGVSRKVLLWANRNGFYYVLDRQTGQFLRGRPFVKVTWARGLTDSGRPITVEAARPSETGSLVWPSVMGGTNWWSPSYNTSTGLFYVGAIERAALYFKGNNTTWQRGQFFQGGAVQAVSEPETFVRALRADTGELVWQYPFERDDRASLSGMLSTAGNVVFAGGSGPKGLFVALHAETGKELWRTRLGGWIHAGPITFLNQGKQLVAVAAGNGLYVFESGGADAGSQSGLTSRSDAATPPLPGAGARATANVVSAAPGQAGARIP